MFLRLGLSESGVGRRKLKNKKKNPPSADRTSLRDAARGGFVKGSMDGFVRGDFMLLSSFFCLHFSRSVDIFSRVDT